MSNNLEIALQTSKDVLDCPVKDETGLNDFQKLPNRSARVSIPRVGIERFRLPLKISNREGALASHDGEASMFVHLDKGKNGVNMSRFCKILQDFSDRNGIGPSFLKELLKNFRYGLRDEETEAPLKKAEVNFSFNYALKQPSLKSDNWGWQYYQAEIGAEQGNGEKTTYWMVVNYEYSSTCPCSLSMAKQYEEEFRQGKTSEGTGIAAAHGQRSNIKCKVIFGEDEILYLEDLVQLLRRAIPTETQSLVKRIDEQAFAILNGENPMFVEHVARRVFQEFDKFSNLLHWEAKIEHFESLHSHNAVAYIQKEKH